MVYFNPFSAGTDFRRQNLTSIVPALKEQNIYNGGRPITLYIGIQIKQKELAETFMMTKKQNNHLGFMVYTKKYFRVVRFKSWYDPLIKIRTFYSFYSYIAFGYLMKIRLFSFNLKTNTHFEVRIAALTHTSSTCVKMKLKPECEGVLEIFFTVLYQIFLNMNIIEEDSKNLTITAKIKLANFHNIKLFICFQVNLTYTDIVAAHLSTNVV